MVEDPDILLQHLMQLAEADDFEDFRIYLDKLFSSRDSEEVTAMVNKSKVLHTVVSLGRLDYVTNLLDHGVDPNVIDEDGNTPLHLSVSSCHDNITNRLIINRADVTKRNINGMTPLDIACYLGVENIVSTLLAQSTLQSDARQKEGYKLGYTALLQAVEGGNARIVKTLLRNGVNVNANLDPEMGTALHVACEHKNIEIIDILLSHGADVEALRMCLLQTPLMRAAEYGDVDVVKRLIAAGADINRQTEECSTALIIACHFGQVDVFRCLLDHGANPHLRNRWGFTALYMGSDTPEIACELVAQGVQVDEICGDRGEAAIHLACVVGHIETVNMLLEANSNIDVLTWHDESLLWLAVWKGFTGLARHLITLNCDLDTPSRGFQVFLWYYTPLELAIGFSYFELAKLLLVAGCKHVNPIYFQDQTGTGTLPEVPWLRMRDEVLQFRNLYLQEAKDMYQWLVEWMRNTPSLKQICRVIIRRHMTKSLPILKDIEKLPLPPLLKSYLIFSDFSHV